MLECGGQQFVERVRQGWAQSRVARVDTDLIVDTLVGGSPPFKPGKRREVGDGEALLDVLLVPSIIRRAAQLSPGIVGESLRPQVRMVQIEVRGLAIPGEDKRAQQQESTSYNKQTQESRTASHLMTRQTHNERFALCAQLASARARFARTSCRSGLRRKAVGAHERQKGNIQAQQWRHNKMSRGTDRNVVDVRGTDANKTAPQPSRVHNAEAPCSGTDDNQCSANELFIVVCVREHTLRNVNETVSELCNGRLTSLCAAMTPPNLLKPPRIVLVPHVDVAPVQPTVNQPAAPSCLKSDWNAVVSQTLYVYTSTSCQSKPCTVVHQAATSTHPRQHAHRK